MDCALLNAVPGDGWAPLAGPAAANGPSIAATLLRSDHSDNAVRQRVLAIWRVCESSAPKQRSCPIICTLIVKSSSTEHRVVPAPSLACRPRASSVGTVPEQPLVLRGPDKGPKHPRPVQRRSSLRSLVCNSSDALDRLAEMRIA